MKLNKLTKKLAMVSAVALTLGMPALRNSWFLP